MRDIVRRQVSIRDVAKAAGVSITTVSLTLNGKGRINSATRERVIKAADELGYQANVHAQSLITGRSRILAVQIASQLDGQSLVPQDAGFFAPLINAASVQAHKLGYMVALVAPAADDVIHRMALDGAVVVDPERNRGILAGMLEDGRPVVTVGRAAGIKPAGWVDNDHRDGIRKLLDHLGGRGRTRPALLVPDQEASYLDEITDGYADWIQERGAPVRVIRIGERSADAASAAVRELLTADGSAPDSICATSDVHALGALRAALAEGYRVPDDLGICSYVDSDGARSATPSLTALDVAPATIGGQAVNMLVRILAGEELAGSGLVVPTTLRVRLSS
jgi:DNA-binding LacI/PurR family transcriptional regulator